MNELTIEDLATLFRKAARQNWRIREQRSAGTYRIALGKDAIQLGMVEFRVLLFLASPPYHAFSRRSIAAVVSTEQDLVTEGKVDQYVVSLLDQLGEYHNYVQSVPYIGYRFKA